MNNCIEGLRHLTNNYIVEPVKSTTSKIYTCCSKLLCPKKHRIETAQQIIENETSTSRESLSRRNICLGCGSVCAIFVGYLAFFSRNKDKPAERESQKSSVIEQKLPKVVEDQDDVEKNDNTQSTKDLKSSNETHSSMQLGTIQISNESENLKAPDMQPSEKINAAVNISVATPIKQAEEQNNSTPIRVSITPVIQNTQPKPPVAKKSPPVHAYVKVQRKPFSPINSVTPPDSEDISKKITPKKLNMNQIGFNIDPSKLRPGASPQKATIPATSPLKEETAEKGVENDVNSQERQSISSRDTVKLDSSVIIDTADNKEQERFSVSSTETIKLATLAKRLDSSMQKDKIGTFKTMKRNPPTRKGGRVAVQNINFAPQAN